MIKKITKEKYFLVAAHGKFEESMTEHYPENVSKCLFGPNLCSIEGHDFIIFEFFHYLSKHKKTLQNIMNCSAKKTKEIVDNFLKENKYFNTEDATEEYIEYMYKKFNQLKTSLFENLTAIPLNNVIMLRFESKSIDDGNLGVYDLDEIQREWKNFYFTKNMNRSLPHYILVEESGEEIPIAESSLNKVRNITNINPYIKRSPATTLKEITEYLVMTYPENKINIILLNCL